MRKFGLTVAVLTIVVVILTILSFIKLGLLSIHLHAYPLGGSDWGSGDNSTLLLRLSGYDREGSVVELLYGLALLVVTVAILVPALREASKQYRRSLLLEKNAKRIAEIVYRRIASRKSTRHDGTTMSFWPNRETPLNEVLTQMPPALKFVVGMYKGLNSPSLFTCEHIGSPHDCMYHSNELMNISYVPLAWVSSAGTANHLLDQMAKLNAYYMRSPRGTLKRSVPALFSGTHTYDQIGWASENYDQMLAEKLYYLQVYSLINNLLQGNDPAMVAHASRALQWITPDGISHPRGMSSKIGHPFLVGVALVFEGRMNMMTPAPHFITEYPSCPVISLGVNRG